MIIKKTIKKLIPPILIDIINIFRQNKKKDTLNWQGNYATWQAAMTQCSGYDADNILDACKNTLLEVKNGVYPYERDSVVFEEIQYSWAILALLQRIALENEGQNLCVLDFGGSLGSSFYQNKGFLKNIKKIKWCIVEQTHFVECGKQYFEDEQLRFYNTIADCLKENKPDVLLLSGIVQYLETPEIWINTFLNLDLPYIIIDRTTFVDNEKAILTVQNVPSNIYKASYPCWFFNIDLFIQKFKTNYTVLSIFDSFADKPFELNGNKKAFFKGFLLQKK